MATGRIQVGQRDGATLIAVIEGQDVKWSRVAAHASANGQFTSPDHLRQKFPDVRFTLERRPIQPAVQQV